MFLAQAEQATEIVSRAGQEGGYIAMMFAAIVLSGFALLGWFIRQLWTNQREMETYQRETLTTLVTNNHELLGDVKSELAMFRNAVKDAPCGGALAEALSKMAREGSITLNPETQ